MKDHNQFKRLFVFISGSALILIQALLFTIVWNEFYNDIIPLPYWNRGNWLIIGLYVVIFFICHKLYDAFRVGYYRIMDSIYAQIISLAFVNAITYAQICLIGRWLMVATPLIWMSVIQAFFGIVWVVLTNQFYIRLFKAYDMLAVCGGKKSEGLVRKLQTRKDKYNVKDVIFTDIGLEAILNQIMKYEAVVVSDLPAQMRNDILKFCFDNGIRIYITPKLSDIIIMSSDSIHLFDEPLLLSRNQGLTADQKMIKRLVDILLSGIFLLAFSPIMLIIALIIKVYDKGPIFYTQERLTVDRKSFQIIKFRSMRVDSELNGAKLAQKDDDRITPIGKILRKSHFDEIPQFINILKGDMSLVGPRPERDEIACEYRKEIPEFDFRLKVKAGLTGYAQIYGQYNTTPYDKLKLDMFYIRNYSIWLDFKILLLTVRILFKKEKSEGVDNGKRTASDK